MNYIDEILDEKLEVQKLQKITGVDLSGIVDEIDELLLGLFANHYTLSEDGFKLFRELVSKHTCEIMDSNLLLNDLQ